MKRTYTQRHDEWACAMCRGRGGGAVCPRCSAPKMVPTRGLLHPESELQKEYGREWDEETDPGDFIITTTPVMDVDAALTIHEEIGLDEDSHVEFKECGFLAIFPAHKGHYEQPQDFFANDRWRKQARATIPENESHRKKTVQGSGRPQTPIYDYITARLRKGHPQWVGRDREQGGDMQYLDLIHDVAPTFPDGRWLAKSNAPYLESIVVENVTAMLNSRKGGGGTLYLGIEDNDGRVMGFPLTHRQRRTLLYMMNRALLTIHPRLARGDVSVKFVQVYSDRARKRPIENHCVIKICVAPNPSTDVPLYLHPRITRDKGKFVWNPFVPAAPIRKVGSVRRLTVEQIRQHLATCSTSSISYDAFFP